MKRIVLVIAICLFAISASAQVNTQVNIGDKSLNKYLTSIAADYAAGKIEKLPFMDELNFCFGMAYKDFNMLMSKGYNAGDAYLIGMLGKHTGKSIKEIIKNRKPGQGWGELAHQLGIPPSELNKMRVAMKKEWKEHKKLAKKSPGEKKEKEGKGESEGQKGKGKGKNK